MGLAQIMLTSLTMASRASSDRPEFCPHRQCESRTATGPWRFKKKGFYRRAHRPFRVQRYQCQHCGRSFSSQTFTTTYWFRYTGLLERLFFGLVGGSCLRQMSRELGVAHSTVQRQSERLGRHCLLYHERVRPRVPVEPVVLDGFRAFEHSQYYPFDLNLIVGASHYIYGFNDAELRRSGAMRTAQRAKRQRLEDAYGRPDPRATERRVRELLARVVPVGCRATVRSDEHPAYARAIRRLGDRRIVHETTSSREPRTSTNPLFPVNLADLLLRHSSANHKRETIAFSKRRQGALYRAAIFTVWRNYVKSVSENKRDRPPAAMLGLTASGSKPPEILRRRIFPEQVRMSRWLTACYYGRIRTRRLKRNRTHSARFTR